MTVELFVADFRKNGMWDKDGQSEVAFGNVRDEGGNYDVYNNRSMLSSEIVQFYQC